MIEVNKSDIGKTVIFRVPHFKHHRLGGYKGVDEFVEEKGVITSFNDFYVFVRYVGDKESKATRRSNLFWTEDA